MRWLRQWGPLLGLLGLIWILSTLLFSADSTSRLLFPSLRKLIPDITELELHQIHFWVRKLAHVCVYFVLSLVLLRALNRGQQRWRPASSLGVMGLVVLIAFLDELHQWFVPGRGSSLTDVVIDSAAAMLAQVFAWFRSRRKPHLEERSGSTESVR